MKVKFTRTAYAHGLLAAFLPALLLVAATRPATAQVLYGSVVGTVTDPSGAVIPGATVTLTSKQIGVNRSDKTDDGGRYSFVNVLPGNYDVTVNATGFRAFVAQGLGRHAEYDSAYRLQIEVGQIADQVTVEGTAVALQTDKSDTHAEITSRSHHQPADRRVPQLSDADQPGARRAAGSLPELDHRYSWPRTQHPHQRRQRPDATLRALMAPPA